MNIGETDGALMSDVKPVAWQRFDEIGEYDSYMGSVEEGDYVKYDDALATVTALQAEIEAMRQKAGTGRAIIIDLLDQIESLQSYELTRDLEGYKAQAIWDSAIENAKRYAAIAKEKQQECLK